MYNLIEYDNNYSKTSGSLCQYHRDDPSDILTNFESSKFKNNIIKIAMSLKCLSNFWRTLEIINCEINLILTWSESCIISSGTRKIKLAITDTKPYFPIVTLSTQDNGKQLKQLKF